MPFHILQAPYILLAIPVHQFAMRGIILIERALEITTFFKRELTLAVFFQLLI